MSLDLFGSQTGTWVLKPYGKARRPDPPPAPVEEDIPVQALAEEPETKPAARLFNPKWSAPEGAFDQAIGVTVEGELPPESSHVTRVAFTVFALLPDGTRERIDAQEGHLDGGTAAAQVTLFTPHAKGADGKPLAQCRYLFQAKHRDAKDVEAEPIPAKQKPDEAKRVRLSGMIFDANKCFPLPEAMDGIKAMLDLHRADPAAEILIVGHAGGDEELGSVDLAFARAQTVAAFLKAKPNAWLNRFGPGEASRSRWGTRELQLMLSALPAGGTPYYAGNAAGIRDEATTAALKAFQADANKNGKPVPQDGQGDFDTRQALVEAYMASAGDPLEDAATPIAHGIAGHSEDTPTESGAEIDDRRLEAFFFTKAIGPKPAAATSQAGSSPYPEWLKKLTETQDFEHHGIHVQIVDAHKRPVAFAEAKLEGPTAGSATSDAHGFATFTGLKKGKYTVSSSKNGYAIGVSRFTYPTAKTVPGHVAAPKAP